MIWALSPLIAVFLCFVTSAIACLIGFVFYNVLLRSNLDISKYDPIERAIFMLILGHLGIVVMMIIIALIRLVYQLTILVIFLLFMGILMVHIELPKLFKYLSTINFKDLVHHIKERLRKSSFIIFLSICSFFFYFGPIFAQKLFVYPGGDDKAYLFATYHILINHGFSLYFAYYPYMTFSGHIFVPNFSLSVIFYYYLYDYIGLNFAIPTLHLFFALYFKSLTPLSMYNVVKKLCDEDAIARGTLLAGIFFYRAQLLYLSWGGIGECIGYFLLGIIIILDVEMSSHILSSHNKRWLSYLLLFLMKSIFIAITFTCHIYVAMLYLIASVFYNYYYLSKTSERRMSRKWILLVSLQTLIIYVVLSLLVVIVYKLSLIKNFEAIYGLIGWDADSILLRNEIKHDYDKGLILRYGIDLRFFLYLFWISFVDITGIYFFIFASIEGTIILGTKKSVGNILTRNTLSFLKHSWGIILFLFFLSQNSPLGIYYIPYIGAVQVRPIRIFYAISYIAIIITGSSLAIIYRYLTMPDAAKGLKKHRKYSNKHLFTRSKIFRRLLIVIIAISFAIPEFCLKICSCQSCIYVSYSHNYHQYLMTTRYHVLTEQDLQAFEWIKKHTNPWDIFFVHPGGAGPYIYFATGRPVLPTGAIRVWTTNDRAKAFEYILNCLIRGDISDKTIALIHSFNIKYIYVSEKLQYTTTNINVKALLSSDYFTLVYQRNNVYIFHVTNIIHHENYSSYDLEPITSI